MWIKLWLGEEADTQELRCIEDGGGRKLLSRLELPNCGEDTHTVETFTGCRGIKRNAQRFVLIRSVRPHVLCCYVFAHNILGVRSGLEGDEGNEQLEKVMSVISDTYPGCYTCCISPP